MDLVGALRPESRITDCDLEQRRALIAIVSGHYSSFLRRNGNGHEARAPTWTWRRRHHPRHRTRSQVKPFFYRNVFNKKFVDSWSTCAGIRKQLFCPADVLPVLHLDSKKKSWSLFHLLNRGSCFFCCKFSTSTQDGYLLWNHNLNYLYIRPC